MIVGLLNKVHVAMRGFLGIELVHEEDGTMNIIGQHAVILNKGAIRMTLRRKDNIEQCYLVLVADTDLMTEELMAEEQVLDEFENLIRNLEAEKNSDQEEELQTHTVLKVDDECIPEEVKKERVNEAFDTSRCDDNHLNINEDTKYNQTKHEKEIELSQQSQPQQSHSSPRRPLTPPLLPTSPAHISSQPPHTHIDSLYVTHADIIDHGMADDVVDNARVASDHEADIAGYANITASDAVNRECLNGDDAISLERLLLTPGKEIGSERKRVITRSEREQTSTKKICLNSMMIKHDFIYNHNSVLTAERIEDVDFDENYFTRKAKNQMNGKPFKLKNKQDESASKRKRATGMTECCICYSTINLIRYDRQRSLWISA
jgi:hypothetical protein